MLTAPTPEAPTPEPSEEPLLDIPDRSEEEEGQLEIPNSDGTVTLASAEGIVFQVTSEEATTTTVDGATLKLDILERAMLEIPGLEEVQEEQTPVQKEEVEEKRDLIPSTSSSSLPPSSPNEPSRAQSGRENDKIEEGEGPNKEEENEISDDAEKDGSSPSSPSSSGEGSGDSIGGEEEEEEEEKGGGDELEEEEEGRRGGEKGNLVKAKEEEGEEGKIASLSSRLDDLRRKSGLFMAKRARSPTPTPPPPPPPPAAPLDEAPHECERCGKRYKFANFLKVHQRRPCV